MLRNSLTAVTLLMLLVLGACGDDDTSVASADVPEGATFCSVFEGEYRTALAEAVPITDDAFGERIGVIVAWAEALVELAPAELADDAADNLSMHQAQEAVQSAAEFIPGSNEMHAWANTNC